MTYGRRRAWRWVMAAALLLVTLLADAWYVNRSWSFGWCWAPAGKFAFQKGWMELGQSVMLGLDPPGFWKQHRTTDQHNPDWMLWFPGQGQWAVVIPVWVPLLGAAGFGVLAFWRGCLTPLGWCEACGYELAGLRRREDGVLVCPECGAKEGRA